LIMKPLAASSSPKICAFRPPSGSTRYSA
jgi:hypothetical protein